MEEFGEMIQKAVKVLQVLEAAKYKKRTASEECLEM
jgi:hypothetical protein